MGTGPKYDKILILALSFLPTEKSTVASGEGGAEGGDKTDEKDNGPSASEIGSTPSFCVLLHGSLKVENLVALVNVGYEDMFS